MSAEPARAYLGIGEVLAQLRGEFPDVSVSKIRYLESEGLIQPARSRSGYRKFDATDVERLRYILTAQRDQYLPLRVIKDQLDAGGDQGGPPRVAYFPASPGAAAGPLTRRELVAATGVPEARLTELEDFGLVRRNGRQYGPEAVAAVRAVMALAEYGVQARHLRMLRAAADRETALIEQVVAPVVRQRNPGALRQAGRTAHEIASLVLQVHAAVIEAALADAGFREADPGLPGS